MSTQNINGYPIERLTLGDDDFFDIDYYDGATYQTAKIKGSVIKSLASGLNIYNTDGTLLGNRTLDGGNYSMLMNNLQGFVIDITPPTSAPFSEIGMQIIVDCSNLATGNGRAFEVYSSDLGRILLGVVEDGRLWINNEYFLPNTIGNDGDGLVVTNSALGEVTFQPVVSGDAVNFGSTQWSATIPSPVSLPDGDTANGFEFFDNVADKSASGTTSYDEYNISFTRKLTLSGTSGSANINIDGTDYVINFATDLSTSASNFVSVLASTILAAHDVRITSVGEVIKFGGDDDVLLNAITITNVTPDLSGTFNTAVGDHILVPYVGTAYENQRLQHNFRVNFGTDTSSQNRAAALSLRRWMDDSIIGSTIKVFRDQIETGNQFNFITYTADANDPFVTGGFYFALENNTGGTINFQDDIGILIQTYYQKPTKF